MTTVFVYEYFCARGPGRDNSDPAHSLYREGQAMRNAVAEDFRRVAGVDVVGLDRHISENGDHDNEIFRIAGRCDWTLVIAPETGGLLERFSSAVERSTGQLLGSRSHTAVRLCSDKLDLHRHWSSHRVPTPVTKSAVDWPQDRVPAVIKPRDGAGSMATWLCERADDFAAMLHVIRAGYQGELIAQDYVPGRAVSVAFLIGPAQTAPLLPALQLLSADGQFHYQGGELPIPPDLAGRAVSLGRRAIDCVPGLLGYAGVDLVLGGAADGSEDYAIEINPRLTTSYVGLRRLAKFNLAEAMLRVVNGEPIEPLWKAGRVRFTPDGVVSADPTIGVLSG
jgi:predicted ATP-grasp superfamily ATP-dependent carboligase